VQHFEELENPDKMSLTINVVRKLGKNRAVIQMNKRM